MWEVFIALFMPLSFSEFKVSKNNKLPNEIQMNFQLGPISRKVWFFSKGKTWAGQFLWNWKLKFNQVGRYQIIPGLICYKASDLHT